MKKGHLPSAVFFLLVCAVAEAQPQPDQVTLAAPADNADAIALMPTFGWNSATGADTYQIQVAKKSNMKQEVINVSGLTTTSFSPDNPLDEDRTYYWRVRASDDQNHDGPWSDVWSFQTGKLPDGTSLTSPNDHEQNVALSPELTWNPTNGATSYDVELALDSGFSPLVYDQGGIGGTALALPIALDPDTRYYWHVRGSNSVGDGSFSGARWFETIQPPGQVVLLAPSNGATEVETMPTFSWQATDGADSYTLEVSTSSNFASVLIHEAGLTSTSFTVSSPLSHDGLLYWHVRATNAAGDGPFSNTRSFMTVQAPGQVLLSSPSDGATGLEATPTLSWESVDGADTYTLQVSESSSFSSLLIQQVGLAVNSYTITSPLPYSSLLYWRVRATNAVGDGPFSATWSFSTIQAPSQVALLSPPDAATGVETTPTFSWGSVAGADSYSLEVSQSSGFGSFVLQVIGLTTTSFAPSSPFVNGAVLYWRVRATNEAGDGPNSSVRHFTTVIGGSTQVKLLYPADQSTNVDVDLSLSWQSVAGASSYRVEVGKVPDFSSQVLYNTVVGGTQFHIGPLDFESTYFWRVRASNAGSENWSSVASFVTEAGVPRQVELEFPADGVGDQPLDVTLTWIAAERAETYNLQVALDSTFTTLLIGETGLDSTGYDLQELAYSTKYFWRVRGVNPVGTGQWSAERRFTTRTLHAPAAPVLIYPPDGAVGVSVAPVMSWNESEGADSYKLELSTAPPDEHENFVTVVTAVVITQPFFQSPELSPGRDYYWRVQARSVEAVSHSPIWRFKTASATATESSEIPTEFSLEQNYPNPFNPDMVGTVIGYDVPQATDVKITVFDALGRNVESLVNSHQSTGRHSVRWDAAGEPSGIYFVRMEAGAFSASRRMLLVR